MFGNVLHLQTHNDRALLVLMLMHQFLLVEHDNLGFVLDTTYNHHFEHS